MGPQDHIKDQHGVITSKYSYLETDRLVTLVGSKLQDLYKLWQTRGSRRALDSLASLYGIRTSEDLGALPIDPGVSVDFKVGFACWIHPATLIFIRVLEPLNGTPAASHSCRPPPLSP